MKARNRIKPLLTLCCALLLVAAGVFGTLAYLGQQHLHRRQREDHAGRGQGDHRRHACGGR